MTQAFDMRRKPDEWRTVSGGDERTRTADPLLAKQVLYQLSYVPRGMQET
jgi:hypothetical protein